MSKLILKRFACVTETDEIGADSPYFLTFVGDITTGTTSIKLTRQGNWHNEVDQGETWIVNEQVADGFNFVASKTVVLCAMVEEDEGIDINSEEVGMIKLVLTHRLAQFRATGSTTMTSLIRSNLLTMMHGVMSNMLSTSVGASDDFVALKALSLNGQTGEQSIVTLVGDGGKYKVRYAVA